MDNVELEEPYDEEGNLSYGHSEDDLDNDYTGSGDAQSGEDRYANSESNESDEDPDDASANDTEGELSDSVISEDLSMSASDDDEEEEDEEDGELETGSMESDLSGSDQEDGEEVNDTESDVSGSDQGDDEEVNDTESDDISSDSEAVSIEEEIIDPVSEESGSDSEADDSIGEGAGENTTVEPMGSSGMCNNDSTTHHEQESVLTSTRSSPGGNTPAGVQKLAHPNEVVSKKSKDNARRTNEAHLSHRTKPNLGHAKLPFETKHPRTSKNLGKSKADNEISMADELFLPVISTQSTNSNQKPKATKRFPLTHETEATPAATANRISSKKKRNPTVLEMEGSAIQVPANTKQQSNSKASGTKLSKNDALYSHTKSPPVSASDTEEPRVPTGFSNPPKVLLNGIFAGVMMQRRKSTVSVFDHDAHAIIGFSFTHERGKRYKEAGMKKYKTSKGGFTLWWKPYSPSADYFDRGD
ncbi:uncharacterized protein J4E87_006854 [Alternaria ethzedia]|uniref:uncharacterized protein n=1 Tax=Alternaria ethzedia TaxID=181014 RepID=UPI0020C20A7A|nr:uncharacterized protein J4E87_006854 [Alternaria ethzedia]KAI4621226.1 hypothetical protein J4E87_006854 [Alternaria ethzedia]